MPGRQVAARIGRTFFHQDSRLEGGHPLVVDSYDITQDCGLSRRRQVIIDYGVSGGGTLYAEIAIYKPRDGVHWVHHAFDIAEINKGARPPDLKLAAKSLGLTQTMLSRHLVENAPFEQLRFGPEN